MVATETVTVLFVDLVGSTERRARLGDDAFDAFTARFMDALSKAVAESRGREVKRVGDSLMVVFRESVADAVVCASAMHRAVHVIDDDEPPRLRIGISTGEVAHDGEDFFGMPVVEAARLEAAAAPGQTLANAIVRVLVGTRHALRFRDVGALTLKGLPEPLATVAVVDDDRSDDHPSAQPVATLEQSRRRSKARVLLSVAALVVVSAVIVSIVALRSSRDSDAHRSLRTATAVGVPAPKGYTPQYQTVPCPPDVRAAAADATCGNLVVPEDRSKPSGRQVSLLVSRAPPRLPGPVVASTIDLCGCENLGNSLARDHSELIHLGQRGYEGSPLLTCPEFVAARLAGFSQRSDDDTTSARIAAELGRCHDRLVREGIDPAQYNFETAARDVLDLMWVLDIKQANFVAFQHIGVEAFDILRMAPAAVRSLTLDNPAPPDETRFTDPIGDLAGAFRRLNALCEADRSCATSYPELERALRDGYERLQAKPVVVSEPNPFDERAPKIQVLLDGPRSADALAHALGDASTYRAIPSAITNSDDELLASIVVQEDRLSDDAPWGAQASYFCAYEVHTEDPAGQQLEAETLPEFVRAHDTHWATWCKGWPVPDVTPSLTGDIVTDTPVLAFRGDLTPDGNP